MMDTAREPSFVAVGETYGSAACYDLRDRSTALLRLKGGFEPDAVASKREESLNSQLRSEHRIAATATRELESSRERLSILAATTADGIWDYDYDSGVNWWSDRVFSTTWLRTLRI
jgi:PAS domain-containing protein